MSLWHVYNIKITFLMLYSFPLCRQNSERCEAYMKQAPFVHHGAISSPDKQHTCIQTANTFLSLS